MPATLAQRALDFFPRGRGLEESVWHRRHKILSYVLLGHVPVLYVFGVAMGFGPLHVAWEVGLLFLAAAAAQFDRVPGTSRKVPRVVQETSVAVGLLGSSALLVHLSGGYIEAHFHFFVMLPLVAMYQRWVPFVVAVLFVAIHHGTVGVLDPSSVYNHPSAIAYPWAWAGIHAFFVLLECLTLFRLWREVELSQENADIATAHAQHMAEMQAIKERLLRVASHELSTPLTPIKLQLRLMGDARVRDDPLRREEAMLVMQRNFQRLERIVGTVLDAVRVDNDAIHLHMVRRDVAALAEEAAATYFEVAHERGVTLETDLHPVQAEVDTERVSQVIDNLLSNAIKYTPTGGRVRLSVRPDGDDAVIEITDTGTGLDPQQIERLFQPFGMVHAREQSASGTGLGLYISKGIVDRHGGTLGVDSEGPGLGARFWARLPCHHADAAPA